MLASALVATALAAGESGNLGSGGELALTPSLGLRRATGDAWRQYGSDYGVGRGTDSEEFDAVYGLAGADLLLRVAAGRHVDLGLRAEAAWGGRRLVPWFAIWEVRFGGPRFTLGFGAIPLLYFNEAHLDVGGAIAVGERWLDLSIDLTGAHNILQYDAVTVVGSARVAALVDVGSHLAVGGFARGVYRDADMSRPSSYDARGGTDLAIDVALCARLSTRAHPAR